ncbi:hypothetical protein [Paractinoplanes lichenicola]|uniref:Uncharacterized protein n=1 Tax=Paractinoplanes lichenicola TaxID=2802976 RepID=A0ABS1VXD2_9ACTN|nr:hypothetical protein [Actinoplanes lichenicola]MBL7259159.1 hypothetical protein [Actinoplanes lichenicola]
MTVQAVVIGVAEGPARIEPMKFGGEVWIQIGQLSLYLKAPDIERLAIALEQAQEVLRDDTSTTKGKE